MNHLQQMLMAQRYQHTLTDLLEELLEDVEAIELFAEFHPGLWDDLSESGYAALALCQYPQAEAIFSFLLSFHPNDVAFHAAYADALCGNRDYLNAALHYDLATSLAPDIPDGYFYLAEVYMMFRHPEFALCELQELRQCIDEGHYLADEVPLRVAYAHEALQEGVSL